ncbi:DUF4198 domain-containing protein [Campylobacter gastrosuis]|uniref:DUF4198 domain-containing protein n=1 Tax=Campylobacter gastrosuis TaxID=2974576 RepID=A0ABT7HRF7_9BACT|nr:DUF4198 domain-containing protein [Campylobacter gastrosuis]MDL0089443.1 DUF4198 domain-containing protein [Campylobacter gastrosuis]
MRIKSTFSLFVLGGALCGLNAHDFWVNAQNNENLKVQIGYGHNFNKVEKIPEKRVALFDKPYLLKDGKKIELENGKENYEFKAKKLESGSYIVVGEYKPTFWSKDNDDKWQMNTDKNGKNIKFCELAKMSAKGVLNVSTADESVIKPIGQTLEIIPLTNPANFKIDEFFGVQVLFEGKPLANSEVSVISEHLLNDHDNEQKAFVGKTDKNGRINIKLFKSGDYIVSVSHTTPYSDPKICDENIYESTFKIELK